jgi:hypothetical protein
MEMGSEDFVNKEKEVYTNRSKAGGLGKWGRRGIKQREEYIQTDRKQEGQVNEEEGG